MEDWSARTAIATTVRTEVRLAIGAKVEKKSTPMRSINPNLPIKVIKTP